MIFKRPPRAAVALAAAAALAGTALATTATGAEAARSGPTGTQAARPGPAGARVPLPPGWSLTPTTKGDRLAWSSPGYRPGGARVEFFAGDHPLGTPRPAADGRTYRLVVPPGRIGDLRGLQVRAGGRRIDAGAPRARRSSTGAVLPARLPAAGVDPGRPGPFSTVTGEYSLPGVRLPELPAKVEMKAVVVAPEGATGKRPVALFLHGRHAPCYGTEGDEFRMAWPCSAGSEPIPSHRGYLQAQRLLASQGYVTISISANGVNGQDDALIDGGAQARSSLVRLHLAQWASWSGAVRKAASAAHPEVPRRVT